MTDMEKKLNNLGNAFLLFREKAIQAIKRLCMYDGETPQMIWSSDAIDAVRKIPESDVWISVKDRLPEKDGLYLCLTMFDNKKLYYQINLWGLNHWFWACHDVRYWMPLPELPKE